MVPPSEYRFQSLISRFECQLSRILAGLLMVVLAASTVQLVIVTAQVLLQPGQDWLGGQLLQLLDRLLLRRPALAILDEASSALDLAAEHDLQVQLVATGPTLVSVGHRPSLGAFHQWELELLGGGRWRVAAIAALP